MIVIEIEIVTTRLIVRRSNFQTHWQNAAVGYYLPDEKVKVKHHVEQYILQCDCLVSQQH